MCVAVCVTVCVTVCVAVCVAVYVAVCVALCVASHILGRRCKSGMFRREKVVFPVVGCI